MTLRTVLVATCALSLALGGSVAASASPDPIAELSVGEARSAAVHARNEARTLRTRVDAAGGPRGLGNEEFAARHAALAEKHAAHPGNAAAVHAALAAGLSPSGAKADASKDTSKSKPKSKPKDKAKAKATGRAKPAGVPRGQAKKAHRLGIAIEALRDRKNAGDD